MRRARYVLACLAVVIAPARSWAADADLSASPLKLEAVIAYARQHNPEISAARARWRAAQARPAQAGALPDPMLDLAYHNEGFDRLNLGETDFAWLRVGRQSGGAVSRQARPEARYRRVARRSRPAQSSGGSSWTSSAGSRRRMPSTRISTCSSTSCGATKCCSAQFARTAEAKYAVGEGIQQDVLKAQVEESLLIERETTLEQRRQSQTAEMNALLNRPATAPLGAAEHSMESTLTRDARGTDRRRCSALARAEGGGATRGRRANRPWRWRGVSTCRISSCAPSTCTRPSCSPEWEVGVGIKVPLYFATKQRAGVQEAAASLAEARSMRENADRDVQARIRDLYARAQASERLICLVPDAPCSRRRAWRWTRRTRRTR